MKLEFNWFSRIKLEKHVLFILKSWKNNENSHEKAGILSDYFSSNIKNSKNIWKGINELVSIKRQNNPQKISLNVEGIG